MKFYNIYLSVISFCSLLQIGNNSYSQGVSLKETSISHNVSLQINQVNSVAFTSSDLPIIIINTSGKKILDSVKIPVDMAIIDNGAGKRNYLNGLHNGYEGKIGIEYRGTTSQGFPKKPYGFETINADGSNRDVSLLGMPEDNDWILYATYNDKTLMRDALVYSLFNKMGHYATRTRYCELVLNGDYQGIYVLMEKIKRGKNRVNISKLEMQDTSGTALTGGYIIKLDKLTGDDVGGWYSNFPPYTGSQPKLFLQYHYPKPSEIVPQQTRYIQQFFKEFEDALYGVNYNDTVNGYKKYINTDSFIDYMLLTEFCKNVDGYRLSTFMYKNSDDKDGRLVMGPPWDYNVSLGNCNYDNGQYTYGWQLDWPLDVYHNNIPFWWRRLLMDKNFAYSVFKRWTELRKGIFSYASITEQIDSFTVLLNESKERNFQRWPVLGIYVWPNSYIGKTYSSEIDYLKTWIKNRLTWLDNNMFGGQITSVVYPKKSSDPVLFNLEQNYPNPFNPETTIPFTLNQAGRVNLSIYNILGCKIKILISETMGQGIHKAFWNGFNDDGRRVSSGIYFYKLEFNESTDIKRMVLLQ